MESNTASSTGSGLFPEPGPDSGPDSGSANRSPGASGCAGAAGASRIPGGYGAGGPLGEGSTWTAPKASTDPTDSPGPTDPLDPAAEGGPASLPALSGQVSVAAMVTLNAGQTMNLLKTLSVLRSWVDAQEAKALTHLHDVITEEHSWAEDQDHTHALAASEIGAALRLPERTAGSLLDHSELLVRDYRATLTALENGRLSRRHAWAVVGEAIGIPDTVPAVMAAFEAQLIGLACKTTVAKFYRQAQRLRDIFHPESITLRHRKALQDRRVYLDPAQDGMAWLAAFLPTEQAAGIFHRVDTAARNLQGPDEDRTLTQLRADVLVDVLTSAGPTGHMSEAPDPAGPAGPGAAAGTEPDTAAGASPGADRAGPGTADPGSRTNSGSGTNSGSSQRRESNSPSQSGEASVYWGVQAKVFVTVPVMTLLGGDAPGELEGYGPIDPETARQLAGHAPSFTRILTHP
ncbi:DUF222 domain-containing protein, partial [Arthrobacter sp. CAL618]|uniref:DUF222 domain-containing protein n=1 Tax=Arthrobacter sp. CAL618 TaxID=1055770 RepID=UPI0004630290